MSAVYVEHLEGERICAEQALDGQAPGDSTCFQRRKSWDNTRRGVKTSPGPGGSCRTEVLLRDFQTGEDRDLDAIQDQSENDSRRKFNGDHGHRQWRHRNPANRQRRDNRKVGHRG